MAGDFPDWINAAANPAAVYKGSTVPGAGNTGTVAVTGLTPDQRALVILTTGLAAGFWTIVVQNHVGGQVTLETTVPTGSTAVAYVIPEIGDAWDVSCTNLSSDPNAACFVTAETELPMVALANPQTPVGLYGFPRNTIGQPEQLEIDNRTNLLARLGARGAVTQVGATNQNVLAGTYAAGTAVPNLQPLFVQRAVIGVNVRGTMLGTNMGRWILQLADASSHSYILDWGYVDDTTPVNHGLVFEHPLDPSWRLNNGDTWTLQVVLTDFLGAPNHYDYAAFVDLGNDLT